MEVNDVLPASAHGEQGGWERSEDLRVDTLLAFTTGEMYDCSFEVGANQNYKVFKCHKVILSIASSVFQAMFYGNFNEASKDRDDPIVMEKVEPDVFEAAMKFIYGGQQQFQDIFFAAKVFLFADKMSIRGLMSAARNFMEIGVNGQNVLQIANTYTKVQGSFAITEKCQEILIVHTEEALESEAWLTCPASTVAAILQMDELSIEEVDLFKALIRWGTAQVERDYGPTDNEKEFVPLLRAKVKSLLKFIRVESMEPQQVAELLEVTQIFSCEEQKSILLCTALKDLKHLPLEFEVQEERPARTRFIDTHVSYVRGSPKMEDPWQVYFWFTVKKKVQLVEFSLDVDFRNIAPHRCIKLYCTSSLHLKGEQYPIFRSVNGITFRKDAVDDFILHPGKNYSMCFDDDRANGVKNEKIQFYKYKVAHPKNLRKCLAIENWSSNYIPVSDMRFVRC